MTRKEAIENLKGCVCGYEVGKDGKPNGNVTADLTQETIDMSIKALEAADLDGYSSRLWKAAYERGKADAEQRWIPVTERLPEEDKQVLVTECFTGINGKKIYSISLASLYGNDWVTVNDEYKLDPSRFKVVAWMPSPEPYNAESEDKV